MGNRPDENEDSFAFSEENGFFAVADGASDSSFAGQWARALVSTFSKSTGVNSKDAFLEFVKKSRDLWKTSVDWNTLPWFVKNKVTSGAYSTFLGLQIDRVNNEFIVTYVGDSCLFHLDESGFNVYPSMRAQDFKFNPKLIWSGYGYPSLQKVSPVKVEPSIMRRKWKNGDSFLLATDAVSKWIIESDSADKITEIVEGFDGIEEKVVNLRKEKVMHNDDVTLMLVTP